MHERRAGWVGYTVEMGAGVGTQERGGQGWVHRREVGWETETIDSF